MGIDKKLHAQYSIGLNKFLKTKSEQIRINNIKLSKLITRLEKEQSQLIRQKAAISDNDPLQSDERDWFDKKMSAIRTKLNSARNEHRSLKQHTTAKLRSFQQFVEPLKNLHQHWIKEVWQKNELFQKNLE